MLAGCAGYDAAPLPRRPDLASGLAVLDRTIPRADGAGPAQTIDIGEPLTIDEVGLLAILNDPDLKAERGAVAGTRAQVLQASLLPDPAASFNYGALITGPGSASAAAAASLDAAAERAYAHGNLDERSLTDYQTTAFERTLQVVATERQLGENHIFVAVELGLDLPVVRIASGGVQS
jgi:hypothetical protein